MIRLTRLNRVPMVLNSDLIEHIDVTPDTVITLTTGQILRVRETAEEVIRRIVDYRRQIFGPEGLPLEVDASMAPGDGGPRPEPAARGGLTLEPAPGAAEGQAGGDSIDRN